MAILRRLAILLIVFCLAAMPRAGLAGEWREGGATGNPGVLPLAVLAEALPREAARKPAPVDPQTPDLPVLPVSTVSLARPAPRLARRRPAGRTVAARAPFRARHPRDPPLARV